MRNVTIDTFIEIGSQHKVCEDYILSGPDYVVLADGCSSSKNSEMGARILCYMAQQFLKFHTLELGDEQDFAHSMGLWVIHNAEMTARHMGLKKNCLDATLVVGIHAHDQVYVFMYGDGYILVEGIDGFIRLRWSEFSKNMPFYLRYMIDKGDLLLYHNSEITKTVFHYFSDTSPIESHEVAYDHMSIHAFDVEFHKSISICSDGVASFMDPSVGPNRNKLIEVPTIAPEMLGFKTTAGSFLKRRMSKFTKSMQRKGFEHFDDLSMGTFLIEVREDGQDGESN
jgi:Protein phosphatase 2C